MESFDPLISIVSVVFWTESRDTHPVSTLSRSRRRVSISRKSVIQLLVVSISSLLVSTRRHPPWSNLLRLAHRSAMLSSLNIIWGTLEVSRRLHRRNPNPEQLQERYALTELTKTVLTSRGTRGEPQVDPPTFSTGRLSATLVQGGCLNPGRIGGTPALRDPQ